MRASVIAVLTGVLFTSSLALAVPTKVAQQGRLLDGDGVPLSGPHQLDYALFDASSGGTELWFESQEVSFDGGYYSIELGGSEPLDDLLLSSSEVWLELSVDGVLLEPRLQLVSVPFALRSISAEHLEGGVVDAVEIFVGGQLIVDGHGQWVGPSSSVSWANLNGVPSDLLDGDADSLAGLACLSGQVPAYDEGSGLWVCSSLSGPDTLALLTCTDGQVVTWDDHLVQWRCDDQFHLTEGAIEDFITNGIIDLAAGTTVGGLDLVTASDLTTSLPWSAITNIPGGLDDGDNDTLLGLPCADGFIAKFSSQLGAWDCAPDLDSQLSEAQVEDFITNAALDLAAGSTLGGQSIATGSHTTDSDTQLSEAQVENFITNAAIDLASSTSVGGLPIATGAHAVDTQLSEAQVEDFITNAPLDLAAATLVGGQPITTGPHTVDTDTDTQLSESQVEGFVTNSAIDLAVGSSINGALIATGPHTTVSALTESQVEAYITNGPLSLGAGTTLAGASISTGSHTINTNTQLTEGQVESYITNSPISLAVGSTMGGVPITTGAHTTQFGWSSITGMPGDISDGDSDLLASLNCQSNQVPKWSAAFAAWQCAADIDTDTDTDTNTQLTEAQVENFIQNGPIGLASGSTLGGQVLVGGSHTTNLDWSSITSIPSDFSDGDNDVLGGLSCTGGQVARFDASISQWACASEQVLTESQVENFITNGAIALNSASTLEGQAILSVASTGQVSPATNLSFDSSTLFVDATNNRVGVGGNSPNRTLEVTTSDGLRINNSNSGVGGYLELTNSGDNTDSWTLERDGSGAFMLAHHAGFGRGSGNTTSPLYIDDTDRVGVGTSSPQSILHVVGGSNSRVRLEGDFGGIDFYDNGSNRKGYVGQDSNSSAEMTTLAATNNSGLITFDTIEGGTPYERVRISNDGKVGIGTDNPSERLSVAGTIESTSGGVKFPDGTTQTSAAAGGATGGVMYIRYDQVCPSGWTQYDINNPVMGTFASDICYRTDTACLVMYIRYDQYCPTGWTQHDINNPIMGDFAVDACWRCN